jgi:hypothetical protein
MKRSTAFQAALPLHDYRSALQSAVSWLGDRYLLAAPIAARRGERQTIPSFAGTSRWVTHWRFRA